MKFDIQDLKIGQIVYLKPVNNATRYIKDDIVNHIREAEIEKIGKKYFYLKGYARSKFGFQYDDSDSCTDISDYCADYVVYLSKQEILDEFEQNALCLFLKDYCARHGKVTCLTLQQLRKIKALLDEFEN